MREFRIWGRTEHVGPQQFFVVVSAVPDPPVAPSPGVEVDRIMVASRSEANQARDDMMRRMGGLVRARGDRVVDVEE